MIHVALVVVCQIENKKIIEVQIVHLMFESVVRNNNTLVKSLFPESEVPLRELRDFASATLKRDPKMQGIDLDMLLARAGFGHGIAKAALKVSLARQAIQLLRDAGGTSAKNKIMADVLGYDPGKALISSTPAVIGGTTQTLGEQSELQ